MLAVLGLGLLRVYHLSSNSHVKWEYCLVNVSGGAQLHNYPSEFSAESVRLIDVILGPRLIKESKLSCIAL